MSNESMDAKLKELSDRYKGKRVYVKESSGHPHAGEVGEIEGMEWVGSKPAIKIKGEWNSFYVFDNRELQYLK